MSRTSWVLWMASLFALTVACGCRTPGVTAGPGHIGGFTYDHGGIVRGPQDVKRIALIFTGGAFGEGTESILDALAARHVKGSFFVTGDFLRNPEYQPYLRRIVAEGHYLGPHSDKHPLYCPWDDRSQTLVTEEAFRSDIEKNLTDLSRYGLKREQMRFFIPPYEWYNERIVEWARSMGLVLANFTPGSRSNADYTSNADKAYLPSAKICESVLNFEAMHPYRLNGFLLLLHLGSGPGRTDKMHPYVGKLLDELRKRGYEFVRVDEMLAPALLARANRDIEVLRWLIRMATDRKLLTPRQYEYCCMSLNECGRMVGGWCKQASSRKRNDDAPGQASV